MLHSVVTEGWTTLSPHPTPFYLTQGMVSEILGLSSWTTLQFSSVFITRIEQVLLCHHSRATSLLCGHVHDRRGYTWSAPWGLRTSWLHPDYHVQADAGDGGFFSAVQNIPRLAGHHPLRPLRDHKQHPHVQHTHCHDGQHLLTRLRREGWLAQDCS